MATQETIQEVVSMLFQAPLANKPKPLPGQSDANAIQRTVRIYFLALQDIDDELVQAAAIQCLSADKWFPAVSDLRQAAVGIINKADDTPDAYTAWQQVKKAATSGSYRIVAVTNPETDELEYRERGGVNLHPLARKAIDSLGGIKEYAMSPLGDEGQWRARFIMAFETYQRRQVDDSMMLPQIAGYIEKRKELNGQSVSELMSGVVDKLSIKDNN